MTTRARPLIRALLIDISGTLMIGSAPTPRAVGALAELRCARFPFRFCSNTSKESTSDLQKRMLEAGFDVQSESEELWTSVKAVRSLIEMRELKRPYFLLSESAKYECISTAYGHHHDPNVPYDAVIVGLAPANFDYDHLNTAFRILIGENDSQQRHYEEQKPSIPLIALHKARFIESSGHGLMLGPGPFVAALENATGKEAEVLGKPSKAFFQTAIESLDYEGPNECIAVIGDDIETDLGGGAIDLGLWRILVKTGKYRLGDESRDGIHSPDEAWDSFADFVDSLVSVHNAPSVLSL